MGTFYYDETDENDVQLIDGVQLVEWVGDETSGVHTYTYNGPGKGEVGNYKQWDGNLIYSFFAWYPTNLEFNTGATKSDGTAIKPYDFEGNPYIRYTLPTGVGARAAMEDVMTACRIDVTKYNITVTNTGNTSLVYENIANLKDSTDVNVKGLHLSTAFAEDAEKTIL